MLWKENPKHFESKMFSQVLLFFFPSKKIKLVQCSSGYNDLIPGGTVIKLGALK